MTYTYAMRSISILNILKKISFGGLGVFLLLTPLFTSASSCPNLYRNLSFGSRGQDVVSLQNFLIEEGDLAAWNNTGYFGVLTQAAVRQWQSQHAIVSSGTAAVWLTDGQAIVSTPEIGNVDTSWQPIKVADFNADGKSDILWKSTSGEHAIWLMNGGTAASTAGIGTLAASWSVAATGDFNDDTKADLLWHNTDGTIAIWLMNGTSVTQTANLNALDTGWMPLGVEEF